MYEVNVDHKQYHIFIELLKGRRQMDSRLTREREFHNERFEHNAPRSVLLENSSRGITQDALNIAYDMIKSACPNATVLDYGCAMGESTFFCARNGALIVYGIDISEVAIAQAQQESARLGITNVRFRAMNAEDLDFPSDSIDLICGFGILHHLDLDRSCAELARVLRASGKAVFLEPMGHNPAINLFRKLTPGIRTPDEHPLLMRDIRNMKRYFRAVNGSFVNFTTLATVPFSRLPGCTFLRGTLRLFDKVLFRVMPPLQRFAWNVVLEFADPIRGQAERK